ncbi:MAG: hypothetical protein C5B52_18230 [Bacteroidetes bacterium]|nr:MAG: hypothetical protein C5B52_18230 [Bacteroidota bacterium]
MKLPLKLTIILPILTFTFYSRPKSRGIPSNEFTKHVYETVSDIPPPQGYSRMPGEPGSFSSWLSQIKLKHDNRVHLYNGSLKRNQTAQFAVLDISVGDKDLQQCADALMRLRAEWLYSRKRYQEIIFKDNAGKEYVYRGGLSRDAFDKYLELVFQKCGTLSLSHQLHRKSDLENLLPGDVLIKGGSPGHAVIIIDMAVNHEGKKLYLLAQSYMPAQDIHILINPQYENISPWYNFNDGSIIETPEWTFTIDQFSTW